MSSAPGEPVSCRRFACSVSDGGFVSIVGVVSVAGIWDLGRESGQSGWGLAAVFASLVIGGCGLGWPLRGVISNAPSTGVLEVARLVAECARGLARSLGATDSEARAGWGDPLCSVISAFGPVWLAGLGYGLARIGYGLAKPSFELASIVLVAAAWLGTGALWWISGLVDEDAAD